MNESHPQQNSEVEPLTVEDLTPEELKRFRSTSDLDPLSLYPQEAKLGLLAAERTVEVESHSTGNTQSRLRQFYPSPYEHRPYR